MAGDPVDEAVRARREMEPAWDELREQRVLSRVVAARRARSEADGGEADRGRNQTERERGGYRRAIPFLAVAAAAGALIAWLAMRGEPTIAANEASADTTDRGTEAPRAGDPARLDLADGSTAILSPDARVRVDRQTEREIAIVQQAGSVTYDVARRPSRAFVVHAAHAVVTVRGTRFTVAIDDAYVDVEVEEGRVDVRAGERTTLLGAGERIRVAPPSASEDDRESGERPTTDREARVREPRAVDPPEPPADPAPTLAALQREADAARRAGRVDEAARILRSALEAHPADPRAQGAHFTLGRLERRRGDHAEAARAFARARAIAPTGSLAEDALAEEAVAWREAGEPIRAAAAARRYLELHPDGLHAPRMRDLTP